MFSCTRSALFARRLQSLSAIVFLLAGLSQRAVAFDTAQKMTALAVQYGTDSFAASNRFGSAFTGSGQTLNTSLGSAIQNGTVAILIEMPGITNFPGNNQPSLNIAIVGSTPVSAPGYNPISDLDWWYNPHQSDLGSNGVPTNQMAASIAANVLSSSGGRFSLTPSLLNMAGGSLNLSSVVLQATVVALTKPVTNTSNGLPPGHLAAENLQVPFPAFASMTGGKLKGNISAACLAATPIPITLVGNGSGYTATNTWLDILVGGYSEVIGLPITLINATQPDQSDPAAPVVGSGPPYKFFATNKSVTSAKDSSDTVVNLSDALNAAAYSSYFTFSTGRVIAPPPALLSVSNSASGVVVSWPSVLTGWTLQSSDSLTNSNWTNYPGVSGNSATINPPSTGNLFFRLNY